MGFFVSEVLIVRCFIELIYFLSKIKSIHKFWKLENDEILIILYKINTYLIL